LPSPGNPLQIDQIATGGIGIELKLPIFTETKTE